MEIPREARDTLESTKLVETGGDGSFTVAQTIQEIIMPRYISLLRFTDKGAKEIKKSTNRAHAFDRAAKKAGVTVEGQFWTLGSYDGALLISAANEVKALQLLAELASQGNVRSETMLALTDQEFDKLAG